MTDFRISRPLFAFTVGTRVALGIGIGLLLSERLGRDRRRAVGLALMSTGIATTIPIAIRVFRDSGLLV